MNGSLKRKPERDRCLEPPSPTEQNIETNRKKGEGNQSITKFPEPRIPEASHGKGREEEDAIRQHPNSIHLFGGCKMPEHWVGGREGEISGGQPPSKNQKCPGGQTGKKGTERMSPPYQISS